jgi:hypothetical protein
MSSLNRKLIPLHMVIGYARVSTHEQNIDLQKDALRSARCEHIYTDTMSGAKAEDPRLQEALNFMRQDDVLPSRSVSSSCRSSPTKKPKGSSPALWLRKKKVELDERVARAQAVYDEYAALVEACVLSNEEIAHLTNWLAQLREQIENGEPLDFETRRAVIEPLNITGR